MHMFEYGVAHPSLQWPLIVQGSSALHKYTILLSQTILPFFQSISMSLVPYNGLA